MHPVGFEPTISAGERPRTYALDRAATGIGIYERIKRGRAAITKLKRILWDRNVTPQNKGNACYHSLQNLLSSRSLSENLKIKIYRTIILSVLLYGCETCSLTLREERKLRVFENMVLRRIFGPRRDEVTGEWRRLHNEEINVL